MSSRKSTWRKRRAEKLAKKNADRAGGKGNLTKKKRRR